VYDLKLREFSGPTKRAYMKDKTNTLDINNKNKNITHLYKNINKFKNGYHPITSLTWYMTRMVISWKIPTVFLICVRNTFASYQMYMGLTLFGRFLVHFFLLSYFHPNNIHLSLLILPSQQSSSKLPI
jgi:hypothetical protein